MTPIQCQHLFPIISRPNCPLPQEYTNIHPDIKQCVARRGNKITGVKCLLISANVTNLGNKIDYFVIFSYHLYSSLVFGHVNHVWDGIPLGDLAMWSRCWSLVEERGGSPGKIGDKELIMNWCYLYQYYTGI